MLTEKLYLILYLIENTRDCHDEKFFKDLSDLGTLVGGGECDGFGQYI
jgi:hypothetical protein